MSKSSSNFEFVITRLILKLECRSKAQNVGHWTRYLVSMHNFRWDAWRKRSVGPENFVSFEKFVILNIAFIWHQKWKDHVRITQDKCIIEWKRRWWRHRATTKSDLYIPLYIALNLIQIIVLTKRNQNWFTCEVWYRSKFFKVKD